VFQIIAFVLTLWFVFGPGISKFSAQTSSAWGAGASTDPEAGPFDGTLLLSLLIIVQLQITYYMRLPFLYTTFVVFVCTVVAACVAPPLMQASEPALPVIIIRSNVFAFMFGIVFNALAAAFASFSWELRCRAQLLTVTAASAAERDSQRLLCNLMPPSVVATLTSGREVTPVSVHNVVILVRVLWRS
jgi:hypothetical protein